MKDILENITCSNSLVNQSNIYNSKITFENHKNKLYYQLTLCDLGERISSV